MPQSLYDQLSSTSDCIGLTSAQAWLHQTAVVVLKCCLKWVLFSSHLSHVTAWADVVISHTTLTKISLPWQSS